MFYSSPLHTPSALFNAQSILWSWWKPRAKKEGSIRERSDRNSSIVVSPEGMFKWVINFILLFIMFRELLACLLIQFQNCISHNCFWASIQHWWVRKVFTLQRPTGMVLEKEKREYDFISEEMKQNNCLYFGNGKQNDWQRRNHDIKDEEPHHLWPAVST